MTDEAKHAFRPRKPEKPERKHIGLAVELGLYDRIRTAATRCGLSIDAFAIQAIEYAMTHIELPPEAKAPNEEVGS